MSAFSILDKNKWSSQQLRELDRHRMIVISRTKKRLSKIECSERSKLASYDKPRTAFLHIWEAHTVIMGNVLITDKLWQ